MACWKAGADLEGFHVMLEAGAGREGFHGMLEGRG